MYNVGKDFQIIMLYIDGEEIFVRIGIIFICIIFRETEKLVEHGELLGWTPLYPLLVCHLKRYKIYTTDDTGAPPPKIESYLNY